jgi:hypothetical protein
MTSSHWMVVLIVLIVMTASVLRAKYGHHRPRRGGRGEAASGDEHAENLQLREEVKQLKERIHVLERITVEKENSLARQIEELRDR